MKNSIRTIRLGAGLLGAGLAAFAGSASAADVDNGLNLARHWCAACHVVAADQTKGSADVPTFGAIARRMDPRALTLVLTKPHGQMPDMALSRPEVADLVAYISSLGPTPVPPETKPEKPSQGLNGAIVPQK